jgi:hypothetical protein
MSNTPISMHDVQSALAVNFEAGNSIILKGASGIGKTDIALAYAEQQGEDYGLFELNCATASLPDVIGLQMPHNEVYTLPDGTEKKIISSRFAYPYFMRDKRTGQPAFMFKRGMVVLEEYGQAQGDVKRALADIILNGRSGEHNFCEEVDVLLLSNRPEDRSGVTKDFDFLINRRVELLVNATLDGWLVWAHAHGVSNMSMAFAARNTDKVFANKAPEKQGPWLTPRSLVMADNFLKVALKKGWGLDDTLTRVNLAGMIGDGMAHIYIAFAKIRDKLPTLAEILADPVNATLPSEPDQQMFLAFDLAAKTKVENIKPIVTYIDRMPKDFSVAYFRAAGRRDKAISSTKEFGDWAVANIALMTAVAGG